MFKTHLLEWGRGKDPRKVSTYVDCVWPLKEPIIPYSFLYILIVIFPHCASINTTLDLVFILISFLRLLGGHIAVRESESNLSHKGKFRDPTISRKNPHEPMVACDDAAHLFKQ